VADWKRVEAKHSGFCFTGSDFGSKQSCDLSVFVNIDSLGGGGL
jgi:hypothetical protein